MAIIHSPFGWFISLRAFSSISATPPPPGPNAFSIASRPITRRAKLFQRFQAIHRFTFIKKFPASFKSSRFPIGPRAGTQFYLAGGVAYCAANQGCRTNPNEPTGNLGSRIPGFKCCVEVSTYLSGVHAFQLVSPWRIPLLSHVVAPLEGKNDSFGAMDILFVADDSETPWKRLLFFHDGTSSNSAKTSSAFLRGLLLASLIRAQDRHFLQLLP
jgi:hypothetical protein